MAQVKKTIRWFTAAVTMQIGGAELAVHNGADAATVEAVLRAVKSC